jgi:hypothetical protein
MGDANALVATRALRKKREDFMMNERMFDM